MHVGYARVSTLEQDLSAQREALERLGVENKNIYFDHGLTGTTRARPGLREALAATRDGDTLVVTKLDRLARSLPDARDIADELTIKGVALSLGGSVYDPNDAVGRLLFNVLGMVAEFEADLIRLRTREGMAIARSKGKLKGKKPKLALSAQASADAARGWRAHPGRARRAVQRLPHHHLPRAAPHHGGHLTAPAPPLSDHRSPPPSHHIHSSRPSNSTRHASSSPPASRKPKSLVGTGWTGVRCTAPSLDRNCRSRPPAIILRGCVWLGA